MRALKSILLLTLVLICAPSIAATLEGVVICRDNGTTRPDLGATVYVVPVSNIDASDIITLGNFQAVQDARVRYLDNVAIYGKRKARKMAIDALYPPAAMGGPAYDKLQQAAMAAYWRLQKAPGVIKSVANGSGSYSLTLPGPGRYFALINSNANGRASEVLSSFAVLKWDATGAPQNFSPTLSL